MLSGTMVRCKKTCNVGLPESCKIAPDRSPVCTSLAQGQFDIQHLNGKQHTQQPNKMPPMASNGTQQLVMLLK